jgi:protein gp37
MFRDMDKYGLNPNIIQRTKDGTFKAALKWKEPKRIFTCSWSDFFIAEADELRPEAWDVIREAKHHTWMILTKRPERIRQCLPADWGEGWDHVWIGVSVEKEAYMGRVETLASLPIKTRFISAEPLLDAIDFTKFPEMKSIDWVIVGGESGNEDGPHKYRECKLEWIEQIVNDLKDMGIATFVKQMGSHLATELGYDKKTYGGKVKEWPTQLQVRDFPMLHFAAPAKRKFSDPDIYSVKELLDMEITEIPMLVKNLLQKSGLALLIGGSDVGKSFLGLDLAIAIAANEKDVFGLPIKSVHRRSICIFTEDFAEHVGVRVKMLNAKERLGECDGLTVVCTNDKVLPKLRSLLDKEPADFIFIDMLTDIFGSAGSLNQSVDVRIFLEPYKQLAREHGCVILLNHHTGKGKDNNTPSKNDGLGSQGIEAACRNVLHLAKKDGKKRILTVVKGNNLTEEQKNKGIELELDLPGGYIPTGKLIYPVIPGERLKEQQELEAKIFKLNLTGKSGREIADELKKEGVEIGKSKVYEILKKCPPEIPRDIADGQQQAA